MACLRLQAREVEVIMRKLHRCAWLALLALCTTVEAQAQAAAATAMEAGIATSRRW